MSQLLIPGQPLGGHELEIGPVSDPNLPWVLLTRALLHLKLVAERNHARRDQLILEATERQTPAERIGAEHRTTIDGLFRRLRKLRIDDTEARRLLAHEIEALIETP